jgi:hypothetical protein
MAGANGLPDRSVLAGRIQGFGNVNPPPLEEEKGAEVAKKALGRLGDMVGEEMMLTVEDFREKGAVGAVKDAVADAGDILIDGVSGLVGWIRGDAPLEEDDGEKAEAANQALVNGPSGAAYGVSQASPTGGINAVWVMPEDADPDALASLTQQSGGVMGQTNDPRVPKNIQPYQPSVSNNSSSSHFAQRSAPLAIPGGPVIAPYEPAPSGPPLLSSGYSSGPSISPQGYWGPGGYSSASGGGSTASSGGSSGSKALIERISKGEALVGSDVAKRLVSQCSATNTSAKQLAEMVSERIRRLYLGLDGGDPADADAALFRLLGLVEALRLLGTDFVRDVVKEVVADVSEELTSLRSSIKHKDEAMPLLHSLGLLGKAANDIPDLLASGNNEVEESSQPLAPHSVADLLDVAGEELPRHTSTAQEADLLGSAGMPDAEVDLLSSATALATEADLLGVDGVVNSASNSKDASLELLLSEESVPSSAVAGSDLLAGLTIDAEPLHHGGAEANANLESVGLIESSAAAQSLPSEPQGAVSIASHAELDSLAAEGSKKAKQDAFGFVGEEIMKAQTHRQT